MRVFILGILISGIVHGKTCEEWFRDAGLTVKDPQCIEKCVSTRVGLDTFTCPGACKDLCGDLSLLEKILGAFAYYPGLTAEERALIEKFPKDALNVFKMKMKAEQMTRDAFGSDGNGDESDAYRHFAWAALLQNSLGTEKAKMFLDAHESSQSSADPERAMDLANNRAGLLTGEQLTTSGKFSEAEVDKQAREALKNKTLVVLHARGQK